MYRSFSLLSLVCGAFLLVIGLTPITADAQKSRSPKPKAAATTAKSGKNSAKPDAKSAKTQKTDKKDGKSAQAQKDKSSQGKKADAKSNAKTSAKDKDKNDDKKSSKDKDKNSAKSKADDKRKTTAQKEADKRAEAERKRQAAIEEQRRREAEEARRREAERREQLRREAIARARAFEKGLRDETVSNILADDVTGEDLEIRRAAIEGLGDRAGTVVVMDAQNGKILSMVNQKWAIGKGFKPCSTVKLVTASAGITEKVVSETGNIKARTPMDLTDALAYSNNYYFQQIGGAVGYSKMMSYARELGLGATTGINLPGEVAGRLPDPKSGFALNRMSSHGDDFEVTPLQLAVEVSAIANGGTLLTPQVIKTGNEKVAFTAKTRRKMNLPQTTLQQMLPGMMGAVNYGTAKRAADDRLSIAGKTGSCIGQGSWLGLFTSVAPVANPKYAVAVVTRGQNERGKYAAAVAGRVYKVLANRTKGGTQPLIAGNQTIVAPKPKVDEKTAARLGAEEDEESGEETTGGDFTNGKSAVARPIASVMTRGGSLPVAPVTISGNKVKTTNKVYPRGKNGTPPALLVPNFTPTPRPQSTQPTQQAKPQETKSGQRLRIVPTNPN